MRVNELGAVFIWNLATKLSRQPGQRCWECRFHVEIMAEHSSRPRAGVLSIGSKLFQSLCTKRRLSNSSWTDHRNLLPQFQIRSQLLDHFCASDICVRCTGWI